MTYSRRNLIPSLCLAVTLFAGFSAQALSPLVAQDGQAALYREVLERLSARHYRDQILDNDLSQRYLNEYIETLDSGKNYFLQTDVNEFLKWSTELDDLAKLGDIAPGFMMFNRLRDRAIAQFERNISLLEDEEYIFDYSGDESIVYDADSRDWFASPQAADEYWQKRLLDSMLRLILNEKNEDDARDLLIKRYKNQIRQFSQRDSRDVFQLYVNALSSLYDPHTAYFSPRNNENFKINMSLSLEGIGAELTTDDDYTKVNRIIPGGPADQQGTLKAGDKIVGVGQADDPIVDVIGWRIDDVVALIRGAKNTAVRLEYISSKGDSSNTKTITIIRDKVKLEDKSAQSKILEFSMDKQPYKMGVIEIPAFYMDFEAYRARDPNYKSTTRDVFKLVKELESEGVDGIVLDLRNNGGGSLYEATSLTDLFIDYGPVVQIRDADQRVYRNHRASRRALYKGPLIVMINRLSASASEIFAGAMQDYGRALVVGTQSFGKGTVQDITPLSSGQLKLTISKFYRVSGDSTQHRGIIPDIEFPSVHNVDEIGEGMQENALPWDQIRRIPYRARNDLQPLVVPLIDAHIWRRENNPDFVSLVEKLQLSDSWANEKILSLNLEQRRERSNKWDEALYSIENKRLISKGQPPFASIEEWRDSDDAVTDDGDDELNIDDMENPSQDVTTDVEEEENIAESDPMLFEAGKILGDQILLQSGKKLLQLVYLEKDTEAVL
jgi:carboxyl-terminal processing protease